MTVMHLRPIGKRFVRERRRRLYADNLMVSSKVPSSMRLGPVTLNSNQCHLRQQAGAEPKDLLSRGFCT